MYWAIILQPSHTCVLNNYYSLFVVIMFAQGVISITEEMGILLVTMATPLVAMEI